MLIGAYVLIIPTIFPYECFELVLNQYTANALLVN